MKSTSSSRPRGRSSQTTARATTRRPAPGRETARTESPRGGKGSSGPALQAGTRAPDFELRSTPDQTVSLSDFRGRPVVLVFYPADWSPICGDQLALYNEILQEFSRFDAQVLAISVDGAWCHAAYARDRKPHFPLLSDFEPKGEVAKAYGVYRFVDGVCERALFVIDESGVIQWCYVSPVGVNPGAEGILRALEDLQAKRQGRRAKEIQHA